MSAQDILQAAAKHMQDRAASYDKPEGERSMGATVAAFNAVTGHRLTEEQGWLFMALLKAVRSQQGAYRADSYEDGAAYFALAGESAANERNGGYGRAEADAVSFRSRHPMTPNVWEEGERRMDNIARSHGDGEHYAESFNATADIEPGWREWGGAVDMPCDPEQRVDVQYRMGHIDRSKACNYYWHHDNVPYDIVAYRILSD